MGIGPIKSFSKGIPMSFQVYACGGTGAAAAARIAASISSCKNGENILVADTSDSNISKDQFPNVFILPKLHSEYDGSGKLRAKNAEQIKKHVPTLLDQYPPKQYNIVISSGGGGSGSVFAPHIAQAIKEAGKICFIIITNNTGSLKTMENTVNTHKSYMNMNKGRCVPMFVVDNYDVSKADLIVDFIVSALDTLVNMNNYGLDGSDIYNFMNWDKVTDQSAGPAIITVVKDTIPQEIKGVITTITLASTMKEPSFDFVPEYSAFGVYDSSLSNREGIPDTHFVISKVEYAAMFESIKNNLEKEKKRIENNKKASVDDQQYSFDTDGDDIVL